MNDLIAATKHHPSAAQSHLTKRDLERLFSTFGEKYEVAISSTAEGFWFAAVMLEGKPNIYSIATARGELKVWRSLENAIEFVQESCPNAVGVKVEIGGWTLTRLNNASPPTNQTK